MLFSNLVFIKEIGKNNIYIQKPNFEKDFLPHPRKQHMENFNEQGSKERYKDPDVIAEEIEE